MPARVINLDDPSWADAVFFLEYRGTRIPIDRHRLLDLLTREQDYLGMMAGAERPAAAPVKTPAKTPLKEPAAEPPTRAVGPTTSHASLSYRIKRIYDFSQAQEKLRPTHAGVLSEMLQTFDWSIPEHPNTKLEQHLSEMLAWASVGDDLKEQIEGFLKRYLTARKLA